VEMDAPSPHKSVTTKTAVALRGYKTERESRINDNWKVIIQKRRTTTKEKIAVGCVAKRFCGLEW